MLLALPLFVFAGRAKAEPARQTTTKRRKRKNSASSANSSVGTAAGKKRSPATNFSLSSQVPVSISPSRFAFFFMGFIFPAGYKQAPGIPTGIAAIRFNLFARMGKKKLICGGVVQLGQRDKESPQEFM